ncbi:MAG: pseudouridine synthase [Christensenellales bacterium]
MKLKAKQKEKLIKFLIHNIQGMSFGSAQKSIRLGKIKVNGKKIKDNIDINIGDDIEIYEFKKAMPQVPIIYQDNNILIVNKLAGIECATRDKSSENTYSLEEIFESENAIVVHRLDRLTEGLVVIARNKEIARKFEEYFRLKKIDKFYKACVYGVPSKTGIFTAYLKKNSSTALMEVIDTPKDGYKEIITEFNIIKSFNNYSLIDIKLHTGRTHQIRAHLSHLGYGIIGDNKYNKSAPVLNGEYKGYYLTAYKLKFNLDDELSYLNELNIDISPTWLRYVE